jgi:hypothetical protein
MELYLVVSIRETVNNRALSEFSNLWYVRDSTAILNRTEQNSILVLTFPADSYVHATMPESIYQKVLGRRLTSLAYYILKPVIIT